jgi:hypothetical protein
MQATPWLSRTFIKLFSTDGSVDMRLYRCLPYLHKIRTDSSRPHHMLERQRPLVVGARVWLAVSNSDRNLADVQLVRLSYEISYNHALPILFPSQRGRSQYARGLLEHPLSTLHDSRLVVSVEMCEVRGELTRVGID